jgi:hypothetical protein
LKPHTIETWKLSTDPMFADKVRDVVGLYMSPPENALVLAVDDAVRADTQRRQYRAARLSVLLDQLQISPTLAEALVNSKVLSS